MLTTDVALRLKKPPAGLCICRERYFNEPEWRRLAGERGPLTVFPEPWSLRFDPAVSHGAALHEMLLDAGPTSIFSPHGRS